MFEMFLLQAHVGGCSFQGSPCPNQGCKAMLPRHALEAHAKECQFRLTTCVHCSATVAFYQLEVKPLFIKAIDQFICFHNQNHYLNCEEVEVHCEEILCDKKFKRKDVRYD